MGTQLLCPESLLNQIGAQDLCLSLRKLHIALKGSNILPIGSCTLLPERLHVCLVFSIQSVLVLLQLPVMLCSEALHDELMVCSHSNPLLPSLAAQLCVMTPQSLLVQALLLSQLDVTVSLGYVQSLSKNSCMPVYNLADICGMLSTNAAYSTLMGHLLLPELAIQV